MATEDNRRIAKNTIILYIRKIIGIFIAFYSSRVLLQALGVNDFGLYGLIGSIVALFSSLRGLFSSSIQRFINIAIGKNDDHAVNEIFSAGVKIHIYISIIFFIIVETSGIFIIPKLNIAQELIGTSQWVLQFSILSTITTIMTIPYDALIIAKERFDAYATFAIIESCLRLVIIFVLFATDSGRIIIYSALVFLVSVLVRFLNMVYCKKQFGDITKYQRTKNNKLIKEMTKFAGWQFFGSTGYAISTSGLNFILNIFGGTVANAARAITYQVMNMVQQFMNDVNISFQPQIMGKYAKAEYGSFQQLLFICTKATFAICSLISFPIIVFAPVILQLWLINVPAYTVIFVRLIMLYLIIRSFHTTFDILYKTYGDLKYYQVTEFITLLINIPLAWILLKFDYPLYSVFISMIIVELFNLLFIAIIAKCKLGFDIKSYLHKIVYRTILCIIVIIALGYIVYNVCYVEANIWMISLYLILYFMVILITILGLLFTKNENQQFVKLLKSKRQ